MRSPWQILQSSEGKSLDSSLRAGVVGVITAAFLQAISLLQAVTNVTIRPVQQLAFEGSNIVSAFVGGGANIIRAGAITTQQALLPGSPWAVGPLTFAFSIIAAAAGVYVMGQLLALPFTSDTIPFTFTDIPFVGVDEGDEDGAG